MQAKAKGAKLIHVVPRFTRTSAMADIHAPIRAGSDVAFLGGLINAAGRSPLSGGSAVTSLTARQFVVR